MIVQQQIPLLGRSVWTLVHWHGTQAPAIIICPGLGMYKSGSPHAAFVLSSIAQALYKQGINSFQFDYLGEGDSDGEFMEMTATTMLYSVEAVIKFARDLGCGRIIILGLGAGNSIACYMSTNPYVTQLCLLMPNFITTSTFEVMLNTGLLQMDQSKHVIVHDVEHKAINFWKSLIGFPARSQWGSPIGHSCLIEILNLQPIEQIYQSNKPVLIGIEIDREVDPKFSRIKNSVYFKIPEIQQSKEHLSFPSFEDFSRTVVQNILSFIALKCKSDYAKEDLMNIEQNNTQEMTKIRNTDVEDCDFLERQNIREHKSLSVLINSKKAENVSIINNSRKESSYSLPFTIKMDNDEIFGVIHIPPARFGMNRPCVIYQQGLGGDRVDAYRCGSRLGKLLSEQGFYVLRYDNRGSGVSSGNFHEITTSRCVEELQFIVERLCMNLDIDNKKLTIISNSAGSKISCVVANRASCIASLVLWGPYIRLKDEKIEANPVRFKRHMSGKIVTQIGGLMLGLEYFSDDLRYDFFEELQNCTIPILMIFGDQDPDLASRSNAEKILEGGGNREMLIFEGGHQFTYDSFDDVMNATSAWIKKVGIF